MRSRKTIYIVTSGDYSDYSIRAVFSKKSLAVAYSVQCGGSVNDAEEWTVVEWTVDELVGHIKRIVYAFSVPSGKQWTFENIESPNVRGRKCTAYRQDGKEIVASGNSYISFEHAKKLATEAIQKFIRAEAEAAKQN